MFVGATTILDNVEHVSNGFIPDSFFDHFDSDAYTSPMFDIDEVFETYQDQSHEQVLTSLHSCDNENPPSILNLEFWLLDSGASCGVTHD